MQTGLSPADRKLMLIAGSVLAVLAIGIVLASPAPETKLNSIPSTYLSTPGGARAAYVLLQRLGTKVERWQEPPFRLVEQNSNTTLVIAEPTQTPSHAESRTLTNFVKRGGRVLFCGAQLPSFFPGPELQNWSFAELTKYKPVISQGRPIELRADVFWRKFNANQLPVYADSENAVGVAWTLGAGEVIWWAAATPLTNAGLERLGNLPLFLNSIGPGRRVIWDEYFHGETGSLWDYAGRIPAVRWTVVQVGLLAFAAIFSFSRRSGPIIAPTRMSRLSPLEFVDTLGGLYGRAKASPVAVDVTLKQLRLQLTRRLGLPISISDEDLATAAAERLGWNGPELEAVLTRARTATPQSALALVRSLQTYTWNI